MILTIRVLFAAALLLTAGGAYAAPPTSAATAPKGAPPAPEQPSPRGDARTRAVDIVSQPARDVGMSRKEIPPPLVKANQNPYSLDGLRNCRQIAAAVVELNAVLGPDYKGAAEYSENRMSKFAEAGGKSVINSIIPFRSLVREVTGAAPADRRMRAAINAGFARRGFLRGVYTSKSCRPRL